MLLMFRLHCWDILPVDDLGIRSAIRNIYALTELLNKKTVEQFGQQWQPYRTVACWYLWQISPAKGAEFYVYRIFL